MADLIAARWTPGYPTELADGTPVEPGSVHQVPAGEAKESDNWQPVRAPKDEAKASEDDA